jgi:hypothetical protein
MKLRFFAMALLFAALPGLSMAADTSSAQFNLQQSTMAPGTVLQPGTYSIRVVDHLQDRYLVSIEGKGKGSRAMFIAVPSKTLSGHSGVINWATAPGSAAALRGFVFKNGPAPLEFVYPKDEAVSLAKANGLEVLAVDPASEGKPSELAQLTNNDMQIVTLWMLTPEKVNAQAGDVKISAAKYQAKNMPPSDQQMAVLDKPAILKRLPHTASMLPILMLVGAFAAIVAGLLRLRRVFGVTA